MIDKNRQILFSIIQMDPGSESMLGWCKNNALNRLRSEYNGAERVGFRSAGNVGDIYYNVKVDGAQGGNVFVKIALSLVQDVSAYFGYASQVVMRCRCRGVVLAETAAAERAVQIAYDNVISNNPPCNANTNEVFDVVARVNGVEVGRVSGSFVSTAGIGNTPPCNGMPTRSGTNYIASSSPSGIEKPSPYALLTQNPTYNQLGTDPNFTYTVLAYNDFWTQPFDAAIEAALSAAAAEANQRSAVFLTDGTELGSVPLGPISHTVGDGQVGDEEYQEQRFPVLIHSGGSAIEYGRITLSASGDFEPYKKNGVLNVVIPEDACYNEVAVPEYPGNLPVSDAEAQRWITDWNAAQAEALTRENARRKKCSDGMYELLRNGFLPPEFEYFIKTTAPKSALVRRKIPMEIIENIRTSAPEVVDGAYRTTVRTAKVTLRYETTNGAGVAIEHEESFTGTQTTTITDHTAVPPETQNATTISNVYTNYPLIRAGTSGRTSPTGDPFDDSIAIDYNIINDIRHDLADYPLMVVANGVFSEVDIWTPTDKYAPPTFLPTKTEPPLLAPEENIIFTHPQFLLDYIAASKPTEAKTPDVPNTDWLSSRLIDGETITIIPLSFINSAGEDRGMFPLITPDEVSTQIKATGYAKVRFRYADASFTEPVWTELDTPQYFDYSAEWEGKNCVCIGSKNPWTDTKTEARTQGKHTGDTPPDDYELTDEEKLYHEVKKALAAN